MFLQHPKPTEQIVRQIRNFIQNPSGNDPRSTSEIQEDLFNLPYEIGESTGTQHQTAPKSSDDMAISNHAPRHCPTLYVASLPGALPNRENFTAIFCESEILVAKTFDSATFLYLFRHSCSSLLAARASVGIGLDELLSAKFGARQTDSFA